VAGLRSMQNIFIYPAPREDVLPMVLYEDDPGQVLLLHHSMGSHGFEKMLEVPAGSLLCTLV
jgi:hypothetical protein